MSHFFFFFYSRRPSPTFSLYFLFSSCVLRLRCYVSSSTSSMLSPPCVNRHTHPQHIIELYCMYCTCDGCPLSARVTGGHIKPARLIRVTLTSLHPTPTGGEVASSVASHPPVPRPLLWVLSSHIELTEPEPDPSLGGRCGML